MKKISLITLLACLTIAASSQSLIPIKFGIKAGLNFSSLSISRIDGVNPAVNSSQIGIAAGACVYIPLSDKWYINPELLYSQKGASFDYNFTHDYPVNKRVKYATTNQLTLSYIELSPTFSFKTSDKLALNFGPSVSYLISEDYTITSAKTSGEDATGVNVLLDGLYESTALDIGLNLGLSYFITANFIVDTKLSTGFMKIGEVIQRNEKTDPDPAYTLKNRAIVLSLAYLF